MKTIEREGEELKVEQRIAERFSEEEGFKAPKAAPKGGKDTGLVGWEMEEDLKSIDWACGVEIGARFKDYQTLCLALGEPVLTGKSKQLQQTRWESHFAFSRSGQSYTITDINLQNLKPKLSPRKEDWLQACMFLLLQSMQQADARRGDKYQKHLAFYEEHKGTELAVPLPEPVEEVFTYLVPTSVLHKRFGFPEKQKMVEGIIYGLQAEAKSYLYQLYSDRTHSLLRSLRTHAYVSWDMVLRGVNTKGERVISTPDEYALFVSATRKALDHFKCKTLWAVYKKQVFKEFEEMRRELACERLKWESFTECYAIRYTEYTMQAWLTAEASVRGLDMTPEKRVEENVRARIARWLTEFVEECERKGVGKGVLREILTVSEV